jgi:hypothetical protein
MKKRSKINIKIIILIASVLFIWLFWESKFLGLFDKIIIPLLSGKEFISWSEIDCNMFTQIITFAIITIYLTFCIVRRKYYLNKYILASMILFIFFYFKYRTQGIYISLPNIYGYGYSDILIILLLVVVVFSCIRIYIKKCKKKDKEAEKSSPFISDNPIVEFEDDFIDFEENVKSIAKKLENANTPHSFGIIASWGSGKTSYLNLLEKTLKENEDEFLVLKFNPRHSKDAEEIQADFFDNLFLLFKKNGLKYYYYFFPKYLKAIDIHISNKIIPFILNFCGTLDSENEKRKVEKAIKILNKKIIVIIDDFDRLLKNEILEVFKLIDANAAFENMIFISAYDKDKINKILENENFSEKFFTTEIDLPLRPYDKKFSYLEKQLLNGIEATKENGKEYKLILVNHKDIVERYLHTIRDMKHFL